jgi:phosphoribosylamine-glycine ligase
MGTISDANHSLPFLTDRDLAQAKEINRRTAEALQRECGEPFRGILYGGFIAVRDGVRVIEYNARFGDPEALNVLPLLSSDFVKICQAITTGELNEELVHFDHRATVCKYITPLSYPQSKDQKGQTVTFPPIPSNARLYFGDIAEDEQGVFCLGGSRTAGIVGIADTLAAAEAVTEKLCRGVKGPIRFRFDIGTQNLTDKRAETMRALRS